MGARPNRWLLGAGAVVAALAIGLVVRQVSARRAAARAALRARVPTADPVLHVPHIPGSITLDGDTDDPGWTQAPGPARTGPFRLMNGREARPFTSTRMLWGDGYLYLSLYAADEDIRTRTDQPDGPLWLDDSFRLVFARDGVEYAIEVSPKGVVTDAIRRGGGAFDYSWSSGVHASPELDGTINKSSDMDEEWVIEMAVPFESLGMKGESGERVDLSIKRCDTPKNSARTCATWEGPLVLD
ncbi:MAG TPA: carbohydrate-binding family 9-like protein [Polyangiaceae bacterium]